MVAVFDWVLDFAVSVLLFFLNGLIFLNNSDGGGGPPGGGGGGACEKALLQKISSPKHTIKRRDNCFTVFICDNQLVKTKLRCYYKNCKGEIAICDRYCS